MNKSIKVFIVSLADELERRRSISTQLDKQSIDYSFFNAIDLRGEKAVLKEGFYSKIEAKINIGRDMTPGEVGCAASHRYVYDQVLKDKLDFALILEDDAILKCDLNKILKMVEIVTCEWDVLILGYSKITESDHDFVDKMEPVGDFRLEENGFRFGRVWRNWTCGTVAYVISKSGAEKMLDAADRVQALADSWGFFEKSYGLKILHCRPLVVYEDFLAFESSIQNDRSFHEKPARRFLNPIRFARGRLRKILIFLRGFLYGH